MERGIVLRFLSHYNLSVKCPWRCPRNVLQSGHDRTCYRVQYLFNYLIALALEEEPKTAPVAASPLSYWPIGSTQPV